MPERVAALRAARGLGANRREARHPSAGISGRKALKLEFPQVEDCAAVLEHLADLIATGLISSRKNVDGSQILIP